MDFDYIHTELAKPHVTLTLLHEVYLRQAQEEGAIPYAYRTFTEHYHNFARKHKATMRIRRKPGELIEVDWAGTTLFVQDPDSGERIPVYVFVASLPCSQLAYVEGSFSMDLPAWIKLHQNYFAYFNGVSHILVPDNLKTGITKHTSKELVINKTYAEMARHYGTVVMPTRVRSPHDKASVESSVKAVFTWIIAALRSTTCFSLDELNQEIRTKLEAFNHHPFTKKEGSRWSAFLEEEQFALLPMPETRYSLAEWRTAKVQPDYHIAEKGMFYSAPYDYIGYWVEVKVSEESLEIYFNHMRIASHPTLIGTYGQHRTVPEHMPDTHRQYTEQTPQHALEWGASILIPYFD
ncbi:IS21 family transposase [Alkalicoccus luteus]|uniref:IS21 family transposase n=1 Tax=Alkalicoccus luteus TaxID=1237094 RepID=UPI0040347C57